MVEKTNNLTSFINCTHASIKAILRVAILSSRHPDLQPYENNPTMSWSSSPAEIRLMVFRHLHEDKRRQYQNPNTRRIMRKKLTGTTRGEQAQYASVNRQWQSYFESITFERLTLGHWDIPEFYETVVWSHRECFVRYIWLRIELPGYGCDKCSKKETEDERYWHNVRFTTAMWDLFSCLSGFDHDHPGITLELSVHSPSDAEHYCQELKNTINDSAWHASKIHEAIADDRSHGWANGRRRPLQAEKFERVFGDPAGICIDLEGSGLPAAMLPRAEVVKQFQIRLQFYRHFSRMGLSTILESLSNLESFHYECYEGFNSKYNVDGQYWRQTVNLWLLNHLMYCRKLRFVHIYERSSASFSRVPQPKAPYPTTGRCLGEQSGRLEELFVVRVVDAKDFFHNFWPGATKRDISRRSEWARLKYLSLTSKLLPGTDTPSLLQAAAAAAERMPELRTIELSGYNLEDKFIYCMWGGRHTIHVSSQIARYLSADIIQCWERVVAIRGSRYELKVETLRKKCLYDRRSIIWGSVTLTTLKQFKYERKNNKGII